MTTKRGAPIVLSEYNPQWPAMFDVERKFLITIAGRWLCGSVEHIGSTAVPGLTAKPIIDIMFGVSTLDESRPAIDALTSNGYAYFPYKADLMHWFCKPSDAFRTHHLHLVPFKSPLWHERIRFRDLLLSDPEIASQYSVLKRDLATRYEYDRETYTEKKYPFIQQALKR